MSTSRKNLVCEQCGTTFHAARRGRVPRFCCTGCQREFNIPKGRCVDCGAVTRGSPGQLPAPERCRACAPAQCSRTLTRKWSPRRDELARLYLDGVPLAEIAERMGYASVATVSVAIHRLREWYGYDLPHRRGDELVERIREARWAA